MNENCKICDRIRMIKKGANPYFVKELETGYVVMGDYQFFKGYTLFLCKNHATELNELGLVFRQKFLEEMSAVGEAVFKAFKPQKLNYELLGNTNSHLHWHIFPRYADDPNPQGPVWVIDENIRCSESAKPTLDELRILKEKLTGSMRD